MKPEFDQQHTPNGDGASLTDRPAAKYIGVRTAGGATVAREDDAGRVRPLPLQTQIRSHSPSGFEWGYGGSGPAQLALAILVDSLGVPRARELYQRFKFQVIARLDGDRWELTREDVLLWVAGHKAGEDES